MNRNQRKLGKVPKKNESEVIGTGTVMHRDQQGSEVEEVFPPRIKRDPGCEKPMLNRCCFISPDQRSFAQLTEESGTTSQYESLFSEQYEPTVPGQKPVSQPKEVCDRVKHSQPITCVDNTSQYFKQFEETILDSIEQLDQWSNLDGTDNIDPYIARGRDEETLTQYHNLPKNFYISEVPRVKIIAEKFTKYKKKNIELRKLEEKVVCVEYDVFDQKTDRTKPLQRLRAFFSIKPIDDEKEANVLAELPTKIKNKFNISSGDLHKLSQKEVEIIDGKILENQSYLDDLRNILRRRINSTKKQKKTLNLHTLYDMAKREMLDFDANFATNPLTNEELLDVRNLILGNCKSSAHGINRHLVKNSSKITSDSREGRIIGEAISRSLIRELLKGENF